MALLVFEGGWERRTWATMDLFRRQIIASIGLEKGELDPRQQRPVFDACGRSFELRGTATLGEASRFARLPRPAGTPRARRELPTTCPQALRAALRPKSG